MHMNIWTITVGRRILLNHGIDGIGVIQVVCNPEMNCESFHQFNWAVKFESIGMSDTRKKVQGE